MKKRHKITIGSLTAIGGFLVILMTIVEKTPSVIEAIASITSKAEASVIPDSVEVMKSITTETVRSNATGIVDNNIIKRPGQAQ